MRHFSITRCFHSKGEGKKEAASPPKKKANPASLCSAAPSKGRGSRGYSLLPLEGGGAQRRRLASLSLPSANPLPISPLPWEGGRWATHPASPSFLWKEVARSAGGWLRSLSPSANPLPFGHPPSTGRGMVSNDRHLHSQPLPIKKRTPASESANPSSQHQLDGFIVLILAKRRKVNHSRFRIATQKPLPLGKRPLAERGIGRPMNKQLVRSYGTDYSKEHRSPGASMPQSASNVPSPCLPFT